jgi:hypothetical protein
MKKVGVLCEGCLMTYVNGTPVAHIEATLTDSGIDNLIRATLPQVMKEQKYWVCAIAGYENDERELYEVPEVRAFCRRLVERGFIASMRPTTQFFQDDHPELKRFLGGIEVWAIAENHMDSNGGFSLTKDMFEEWHGLLKEAEERAVALVMPQDGQHGASVSFSTS